MAVLPPDPVFTLRCAEMGAVNSLCFHQNERLLAGTIKGSVYLWDLQTNRSPLHFSVGKQPITGLHHTEDILISQEKGGSVTLWSMNNTGYKRHFTINANHVGYCRTALHYNSKADDDYLFYPREKNSIGVLLVNDIENSSQILVPDDDQLPKLGTLTCLKPFEYASQMYVLAGYESGHFLTWNLNTGLVINVLHILDSDPMALDYDPVTNKGIIGGPSDHLTTIYYQRPSMNLQVSTRISLKNQGIQCLSIRWDQKVFASGGWDSRVRIFSWKSLRLLAVLTEHKTGAIMDIVHSSGPVALWKNPIMAVAGMDSQISLWNLYN